LVDALQVFSFSFILNPAKNAHHAELATLVFSCEKKSETQDIK